MRVILRKDVLGEATHWKHLDNIIFQIDRGAHEWEVEEPEIIEESGWYQESRDYIRLPGSGTDGFDPVAAGSFSSEKRFPE